MSNTEHEFCVVCGDDRTFLCERQQVAYDVRGETVEFGVDVQVCEKCRTVQQRDDTDLAAAAFAEYRRRRGLLTPEQIKAIRQRYNLSQRSLAALLGMSEATINRYEGGGLQDEAHDQAIRSCDNLEAMRDLLDRRGRRLSARLRERARGALARLSQLSQTTVRNRIADYLPTTNEQPGDQFAGRLTPGIELPCDWSSLQWHYDDPAIRLAKSARR